MLPILQYNDFHGYHTHLPIMLIYQGYQQRAFYNIDKYPSVALTFAHYKHVHTFTLSLVIQTTHLECTPSSFQDAINFQ